MMNIKKITVAIVILVLTMSNSWAQVTLDTWEQVNEGFAKCAAIGESAGEASWSRDDFKIGDLIHRRGEAFAWLEYGGGSTTIDGNPHPDFNTESCSEGLFRHDVVTNEWIKVANEYPTSYGNRKLLTNGSDIFGVNRNGEIYILDETGIDGWKKSNSLPFKYGDIIKDCSASCYDCGETANLSTANEITAIGDTIFFLFYTDKCEDNFNIPAYIFKYNYKSNSITKEALPAFPHQVANYETRKWSFKFADHITGLFTYFVAYDGWYDNASVPPKYDKGMKGIFTYDPRTKKWENISEGPNYTNFTGSGPAGSEVYISWDKKSIYLLTQQGIYIWLGDSWKWIAQLGAYNMGSIHATNNGVFIQGRSNITKLDNANMVDVGQPDFYTCKHQNLYDLTTPDDGKTLYVVRNGMKDENVCDWPNSNKTTLGIYKITPDPDKPSFVRNLHVEASSYIGGSGDNTPINTGVGANYNLFVAGNFSNVEGNFHSNYFEVEKFGAVKSNRGKIIRMNTFGDTIMSIMTLGNEVFDYEIQNFGQYRMIVSGDWGITCLDSAGAIELWSVPFTSVPGSGNRIMVDIDDLGNVAALKATGDENFNMRNGRISTYTNTGNLIAEFSTNAPSGQYHNGHSDYINDITITKGNPIVVGFNNDKLDGSGCGETSGLPVQSAFVRAFSPTGTLLWRTFDTDGKYLNLDQADTRGYRINVGKDGKVYFLGETAGANGVFRWNGKTAMALNDGCKVPNNLSRLVQTDQFNQPINTKSAHISYFCTINPATGEIERGQYIIPRKSNGESNSYRVKDGYIHADKKGFVYIGGSSAYQFSGRDVQHLNGVLIDDYKGGDMNVLIVNPEYTRRTFWGAFTKNGGTGVISGFGIRDNIITTIGKTDGGYMITGATRYDPIKEEQEWKQEWAMNKTPWNPTDKTKNDAYLAVWYQDVWNHSQDSLEERVIDSKVVLDKECFKGKTWFEAEKVTACVGENVTIYNTSINDSANYYWKFGDGSTLLPGTATRGPHILSWETPGEKSILLKQTLQCGLNDFTERANYINVLSNNLTLKPIIGSGFLCEGTSVTYRVEKIWGVSKYVWKVPSGAIILQGQGEASIQVIMGNTSGTVEVYGEYSCGVTSSSSINVNVLAIQKNTVILITGSKALTAGDQALKSKIEGFGYNVITIEDAVADASHAACSDLVIIAPSVNETDVEFKFRTVQTPVITMKAAMFNKMALTNGGSGDLGTTTVSDLVIKNINHDLRGTVGTGDKKVYSNNFEANWGQAKSTAVTIASIPGNNSRTSVFGYDVGVDMFGLKAPNRRVAFFATDAGLTKFTTDANTLLEQAICWVTFNCETSNKITTLPLNSTLLCRASELEVNFEIEGNYSSQNTFIAQLSNAFGTFTSPTNIGSLTGSEVGTIQATIPFNLLPSAGYKIRVVSTDPAVLGSEVGTYQLLKAPDKPGLIKGPAQACKFNSRYTFSVDPVLGATGYLWTIPLGTYFVQNLDTISWLTGTEVEIDFGTGTTNEVIVQSVNECGASNFTFESSRLLVEMTEFPPKTPKLINGPTSVCQAHTLPYTVDPIQYAVGYEWELSNGATGTSTTNSINISFAGVQDKSNVIVKVRAIGECGNSKWVELNVNVDNEANKPIAGQITESGGACSGNYVLEVPPVQGAFLYDWVYPSNASVTEKKNLLEIGFANTNNQLISVTITDACGTSEPSDYTIKPTDVGNQVFMIVGNPTSLSNGDKALKSRLELLGYTVVLRDDNRSPDPSLQCMKFGVVSGSVNSNENNFGDNANIGVPLIVLNSLSTRRHSFYKLGLTSENIYKGYTSSEKEVESTTNIVTPHTITQGLNGNTVIFNSPQETVWTIPKGKFLSLAEKTNDDAKSTVFVFEKGDLMEKNVAPEIRVGLFIHDNADKLSNDGWKIFDQSVCYVAGTCGVPKIVTKALPIKDYCVGNAITVDYTIEGVFESSNEFELQLSDQNGSFALATTLSSIFSTTSGNIQATLPATLISGGFYKVRVVSTIPTVIGTDNGHFITIKAALKPINTIVGETDLCIGDSKTYSVVNDPNVEQYIWTLPNGALGSSSLNTITITFEEVGTGIIKVSASNQCSTEVIQQLDVDISDCTPTKANFSSDKSLACVGEAISFENLSTGAKNWLWSFGKDATPATFNGEIPPIVNYTSAGVKEVRLIAVNDTKRDTLLMTSMVTIQSVPTNPPYISGLKSVCIGDTVIYKTTAENADGFIWSINTTNIASTSDSVEITFETAGTTSLEVSATNSCGASEITSLAIEVGTAPEITGVIQGEISLCSEDKNNTYTVNPISNATAYEWILPIGFTGNSTTNSITTTAGNESGQLQVLAKNTCGNSLTISLDVAVDECIYDANFDISSSNSCISNEVTFTDNSIGATSWSWDFGDGAIPATFEGQSPPAVNYSTSGSKVVSLTINKGTPEENTDSRTDILVVNSVPEQPTIGGKTTVCLEDQVEKYTLSNVANAESYDLYQNNEKLIFTNDSIAIPINEVSIFELKAVAINGCGTSDTTRKTVEVIQCFSEAFFKVDVLEVCGDETFTFTDLSAGGNTYLWSFGSDAQPQTFTGANPPEVAYSEAGEKQVTLLINEGTSLESSYSLDKFLVVKQVPEVPFNIDGELNPCINTINDYQVYQLENATNYKLKYAGTELENTNGLFSIVFMNVGAVTLTATALNACGQSDSITMTIDVSACNYEADFDVNKDTVCIDEDVEITDKSIGAETYLYIVENDQSTSKNPKISFDTQGAKTIELIINRGTNAEKSISKQVFVQSPPAEPQLISIKNSVCVNESLTLEVVTLENVLSYNWDLPDGIVGESNTKMIDLAFTLSGEFEVGVRSENICGISSWKNFTLEISNRPSKPIISSTTTESCLNKELAITTDGNSGDYYTWILPSGNEENTVFGELLTSLTSEEISEFEVYAVNQCGNSDTTRYSVSGKSVPNYEMKITGQNEICIKNERLIYAVNDNLKTLFYNWELNNQPITTSNSDTITLTDLTDLSGYELKVISGNECGLGSSATKQIDILSTPEKPSEILGKGKVCEREILVYTSKKTFGEIVWEIPDNLLLIKDYGDSIQVKVQEIGIEPIVVAAYSSNKCGNSSLENKYLEQNPACELWIPNSFTPSSDNEFTIWPIQGLHFFPECVVKVYNRWGNLVYESIGYQTPWDGTYNGKSLPTGTYYYIVDLNDDMKEKYVGNVTIIK